MRDYNINSSFYSELLQWWDDFRNAFSTLPLTAENIIWNNKLIKIDGKSIYYHNYVKAGTLLTNQMQFDKGSKSLESYNIATNTNKYLFLSISDLSTIVLVIMEWVAAVCRGLNSCDSIWHRLSRPRENHCVYDLSMT